MASHPTFQKFFQFLQIPRPTVSELGSVGTRGQYVRVRRGNLSVCRCFTCDQHWPSGISFGVTPNNHVSRIEIGMISSRVGLYASEYLIEPAVRVFQLWVMAHSFVSSARVKSTWHCLVLLAVNSSISRLKPRYRAVHRCVSLQWYMYTRAYKKHSNYVSYAWLVK